MIINSLGKGGAEGMLTRLCASLSDTDKFAITVFVLSSYRPSDHIIDASNVKVVYTGNGFIRSLFRIFRYTATHDIKTVMSWLYKADGIALLLKLCFLGRLRLYWNIRHSDFQDLALRRRIQLKILAYASIFCDGVIYCAARAFETHNELGYNSRHVYIIPNGYSEPSLTKLGKRNFCRDTINFGCLGRFHKQKNHFELCKGFADYVSEGGVGKLRLAGPGVKCVELQNFIDKLNCKDRISLDNEVENTQFFSNLDWHVLVSTHGEGFPNVVAESMFMKIPNIVSDVGDAKVIVADYGILSGTDASAISSALWKAELSITNDMSYESLSSEGYLHIQKNYGIESIAKKYEKIFE